MDALRNFVNRPDMGQKNAAVLFGVSQAMVSHWLTRRKRITGERAKQIDVATGGAVPKESLRPDLFGSERAASSGSQKAA